MQELVFDRFHSHLIDRIALRDGLVPHERWHGLPSKYHDGEPESLRRRLVEKYFDQFVDLSPWSGEVDRTLTLLALFPEVSTSARSFHWSDHQLVNNIWDINFPNEWIDQTLWNDAIANAFATLRLSGFGDILQTMAADPSFTFTKLDALEQDWIDDLESSRYNLATISYWARALNKRLMLAFERHYLELPKGHLPTDYDVRSGFGETVLDSANIKPGDVGIYSQLVDLCGWIAEHLDGLIRLELAHPKAALCKNLDVAPHRLPGDLADTAMLVRANFSEYLSVVPAPRTLEEAIELRERKEVARLAELIGQWTVAAASVNSKIENRIASDIRNAQRELLVLDRVRRFNQSELGIWIKLVGGMAPGLSTILSLADVAAFYVDRWRRERHVWVSTNRRLSKHGVIS